MKRDKFGPDPQVVREPADLLAKWVSVSPAGLRSSVSPARRDVINGNDRFDRYDDRISGYTTFDATPDLITNYAHNVYYVK